MHFSIIGYEVYLVVKRENDCPVYGWSSAVENFNHDTFLTG